LSEHTNLFEEGYIGVTKDLYQRKRKHLEENSGCLKFKNAIARHGKNEIVWDVILFGEEEYCYEMEAKLRPAKEIGWNLKIGGDVPPDNRGSKQSKETIEKRRKAITGKKRSDESKARYSESKRGNKNPQFGKPSTMLNKNHTPESKKKMSESQVKRFQTSKHPGAKKVIYRGVEYETVMALCRFLGVSDKHIKRLSKTHPEKYSYEYITS
jgi:group I intron endonuclease